MANLIIPRTWSDEQFKQDVMNAVNLLMMQGKLDPATNYEFRVERGKPVVYFWLDGTSGPVAVFKSDPVDIITAAGSLPVIRGKSDSWQ